MEMTYPVPLGDFSNLATKASGLASVQTLSWMLISLIAGPGVTSAALQGHSAERTQVRSAAMNDTVASHVEAVGGVIAEIKEGWQLNMTELAETLGVSRPTVYSWLNGKTSPDEGEFRRLQALAASAKVWVEQTEGKNLDYILDYTGPHANEPTIRDHLKSVAATPDQISELISLRIRQHQQAYAETRKLLGDGEPLPESTPSESTRRMNALWAGNAEKLHRARKSSS